VQLPLLPEELTALLQDALHSFAAEMGKQVAVSLLEHEVTKLCGPRYQRPEGRQHTRYGRQAGVITLAGQKMAIRRPRVRAVGGAEAALETYALLQRTDAMPEACLGRMVRGVSTRDYEGVIERACEGFGVRKSSISRGFVRASAKSLEELAGRKFHEVRFAAIFLDGVDFAGEMLIVALGMTEKGEKVVLGLRQGATENAEVVSCLLEELRERGVATQHPTLFVIDGAKALAAGIERVWGRNGLIQRCQVHKKRNVKGHLAEEHHPELDQRMSAAYAEPDYAAGLAQLKATAKWLERLNPDAAASLREGMEQTLTVHKLGVPAMLRKTLSSTNPIDSMFKLVRNVTHRVTRWREGDMRRRWCAAGLLRAEQRMHRVQGYKQIPQLLAALDAQLLDTKSRAG
jgi:transposase-like protein